MLAFAQTLAFAAVLFAPQPAARPIHSLAGVWVASGIDRPAFAGRLEIERRDEHWIAIAGTFLVGARRERGGNWYQFPHGIGELWTPSTTSDEFGAMWVQPGSAIDSNAYATPVTFREAKRDDWVGTAKPFVPRFELYADLTKAPDGSLLGFLRDPIGNFGTMAPFDSVTIDGHAVTIHTRVHTFHGDIDGDVLRLGIGTGPPMSFRRLDLSTPNGFYPLRAGERVALDPPVTEHDGWTVGTPSSAAIRRADLQALHAYLAAQAPTSPRMPYIQGVLVARDDRLIFEQYYFGFDLLRPHDVRSAGKSFDPALLGAAMTSAPGLRVESPAIQWLPYRTFAHPDRRKAHITVGDFLDMTSGLDCDDNNDDSLGNEDTMQSQSEQPDWYRYVMDLPMIHDPGLPAAAYCSGGMNMTGAFIAGATHRWTPEFFDATVARPMQFGEYHLQLTPTDEMYLGGGSYFLPRDLLKLGELFLDGGVWNGHRVLAQAFVRDATSPHSGLEHPGDYGYGWHLTSYRAGNRTIHAFEAQGNGGQLVVAVPSLRLVVEILAANYGDYETWGKFHDVIQRYVVAACR